MEHNTQSNTGSTRIDLLQFAEAVLTHFRKAKGSLAIVAVTWLWSLSGRWHMSIGTFSTRFVPILSTAVLLCMAIFRAWREERYEVYRLRRKLSDPAKWKELAGEFKGLPNPGIQRTEKESGEFSWNVWGDNSAPFSALIEQAGRMLRHNPEISSFLAPAILAYEDPKARWLELLRKDRGPRVTSESRYTDERGVAHKLIHDSLNDGPRLSREKCLDIAAKLS